MDTIHPVNMTHPDRPAPLTELPTRRHASGDQIDVAAGDALREAEVRAAQQQDEHNEFSFDQLRAMAEHLGIQTAATTVERQSLVRQIKAALR